MTQRASDTWPWRGNTTDDESAPVQARQQRAQAMPVAFRTNADAASAATEQIKKAKATAKNRTASRATSKVGPSAARESAADRPVLGSAYVKYIGE